MALLICVLTGMAIAIPVWVLWQHFGTRHVLDGARRFDPRDAVPCTLEPVALSARLVRATRQRDGVER